MIAEILLLAAGIYLLCGLVFAAPFVLAGVGKIDPHAARGSWGFRVLIIPGSMFLWPLLARRWMKGIHEPPEENNPHRCAARIARSSRRGEAQVKAEIRNPKSEIEQPRCLGCYGRSERSRAMIRPLRQRHRVMVCTLGVLLPMAFMAGIAARKPVPVSAVVPSGLARKASDFGKVVWTNPDLWPGQRIITSLRRDAAGAVSVELMCRDLAKPDVLVYWAAGKEAAVKGLPDNARLLGALSNRTPLPFLADLRGETGRFVLYSLADHEVIAVSKSFETANER